MVPLRLNALLGEINRRALRISLSEVNMIAIVRNVVRGKLKQRQIIDNNS